MLKKREPRTGICFLYYHFVSLSFSTLISISAKTSFLLSNAQLASAQQIGPSEISKFFINDALNALRNNDTNKAITQLILAKEQLKNAGDCTSIQIIGILLDDVLRALHNNDNDKALPRLQLASKQYTILKLELYRSTTSGKITNGNMSQMNMANADLSSPSLMAQRKKIKSHYYINSN
jgi:hypothetical protein